MFYPMNSECSTLLQNAVLTREKTEPEQKLLTETDRAACLSCPVAALCPRRSAPCGCPCPLASRERGCMFYPMNSECSTLLQNAVLTREKTEPEQKLLTETDRAACLSYPVAALCPRRSAP